APRPAACSRTWNRRRAKSPNCRGPYSRPRPDSRARGRQWTCARRCRRPGPRPFDARRQATGRHDRAPTPLTDFPQAYPPSDIRSCNSFAIKGSSTALSRALSGMRHQIMGPSLTYATYVLTSYAAYVYALSTRALNDRPPWTLLKGTKMAKRDAI